MSIANSSSTSFPLLCGYTVSLRGAFVSCLKPLSEILSLACARAREDRSGNLFVLNGNANRLFVTRYAQKYTLLLITQFLLIVLKLCHARVTLLLFHAEGEWNFVDVTIFKGRYKHRFYYLSAPGNSSRKSMPFLKAIPSVLQHVVHRNRFPLSKYFDKCVQWSPNAHATFVVVSIRLFFTDSYLSRKIL